MKAKEAGIPAGLGPARTGDAGARRRGQEQLETSRYPRSRADALLQCLEITTDGILHQTSVLRQYVDVSEKAERGEMWQREAALISTTL